MENRYWQYSTQQVFGDMALDKGLNQLGANGWEAFAVHPFGDGGWLVFLKREMDEKNAKQAYGA